MSENKLKVNLHMGILKPVHDIFEAIVDPEEMKKYFISKSTGRIEGGKTLKWTWEDFDAEHEIKVKQAEKDKLVSFTWDGSGVECTVNISFEFSGTTNSKLPLTCLGNSVSGISGTNKSPL